MFQKKLGNEWIAIDDYTQDAAIPDDARSSSTIDLDFGVFIRKPGSFYAGISATHLLEQELTDLSIQPRRHLYAMGGYTHPLDGDYLLLRTNVLAKTDLAATIADVNVNVLWNQMVWGGLSWRPGDALRPRWDLSTPWNPAIERAHHSRSSDWATAMMPRRLN